MKNINPRSTPVGSGRFRTSLSDPLRIAEIQPNGYPGWLGITFCPGKQGDSVYGSSWRRDVDLDLDAIQAWGACAVITLVESHELELLGVPDLGVRIRDREIEWLHLPIVDGKPPAAPFESTWPDASRRIRDWISSGLRVLVHCRGGLGRAGTVAACILIELGAVPSDAVRLVRRVKPHAIETTAQEHYVLNFKSAPAPGAKV